MSPGRSKPLVGFGPVIEFARELQATRGQIPFRDMAKSARYSPSWLSQAANDKALPAWPLTKAYLTGCGITDRDELEAWKQKRAAAEAAARRFVPSSLNTCTTMADLATALHDLVAGEGLELSEVSDRLASMAIALPDADWTHPSPSPEELSAALVEHAQPPTATLVHQVVRASGGLETDVAVWRRRWDLINASETTPSVAPAVVRPDSPQPARPSIRLPGGNGLRRFAVVAVVVLCAVAATLVAQDLTAADWRPARIGHPGAVAPICPTPAAAGPVTARVALLDLCQRTQKLVDAPSSGRYTYIHVKVRSVDTTSTRANRPESVQDERLWWADDLSGVRITTSGDYHSSPDPYVEHIRQGELHIAVDHPAADPNVLIGQLEKQQPVGTGPAGRLRAVADLNDFHLLDPVHRAAILRVLAETEGLAYRGRVSDLSGRTGIAISADSGNGTVRDTLIFDDDSGQLLSQERVEASETATSIDQPGAKGPIVTYTGLYVERGRRDSVG
jgi:hypothetical protein